MNSGGLRTADYDFELPLDRIAQEPAIRRDASRLLVVDRASGRLVHGRFRDLPSLIPSGDALVLNTSRVLRARLLGQRENGAPGEVLLLEPRDGDRWEAMVHPGGKLKPGRRLQVASDVTVHIEEVTDDRTRIVRIEAPMPVERVLSRYGHVPLPPYITRADTPEDAVRYQTVYAREGGSVAAPTAGLHFTPELLEVLAAKGVARAEVVLHVGAGTFRPVASDDPAVHRMHGERFSMPAPSADLLNATRAAGGHVWAVGTTALRVLETVVTADGRFEARRGVTDVFIRPPHVVRGADRLVTNFHLPRSTLLMLVAAFAGFELTMRAYSAALAGGYRFYSYGDAMCVI